MKVQAYVFIDTSESFGQFVPRDGRSSGHPD
jgi:hypothetical protein